MLWAEFKGDTELQDLVKSIEYELDWLKIRSNKRELTAEERGWKNALFWVRARLEEIGGE